MRKNRTMRVAALLLALTLITSCFVGGTMAKYITTQSGYSRARVAHWGFNEATENELENLFDAEDETGIVEEDVVGGFLIAPGTTGSVTFTMVSADADTAPEVAYRIHCDTDGSAVLSDELEDAMAFYFDDENMVEELTFEELQTKIVEAFTDGTFDEDSDIAFNEMERDYPAGTDVPDALKNGAEHTIIWKWVFEENEDARDTDLGNNAIADLEGINLDMNITVQQLDDEP